MSNESDPRNNRETLVTSVTGVEQFMLGALKSEEYSSYIGFHHGFPAVLQSSDRENPEVLDQLKLNQVDGYLIGVGAGGILTLLPGFSKRPVGIIMTDVNPRVVIAGKAMIDVLKTVSSFDEFTSGFLRLSEDEYQRKIEALVAKDTALKKGLANFEREHLLDTPMLALEMDEGMARGDYVDVLGAIRVNFDMLKQLAMEGNIAMCYADVAAPEFISTVRNLPMFDSLTSVIYLSNSIDLPNEEPSNKARYRAMSILERDINSPVYVYTEDKTSLVMKIAYSVGEVIEDSPYDTRPSRPLFE